MAKDPAFLFYPGDWLGGTMGMTFEQKGCYLELLVYQFHSGRFTEAQAKQVLSICFSDVWPILRKKFAIDGDSFFNTRLDEEINKRQKFSNSRRINALGNKNKFKEDSTSSAHAKHMEDEDENINEDNNINKKELVFPFHSQEFINTWNVLIGEPKWRRKSFASLQTALKKMATQTEPMAIKMMEDSISGNWQGIFIPKENKNFDNRGKAGQIIDANQQLTEIANKRYGTANTNNPS